MATVSYGAGPETSGSPCTIKLIHYQSVATIKNDGDRLAQSSVTPCSRLSRMAWRLRRAVQRRATAILDSRCARCREERQVGTKKRRFESNKETRGYPVVRAAFSGAQSCHGVPRATTVLAKMSIFLAQATSARLCSFPAAVNRW